MFYVQAVLSVCFGCLWALDYEDINTTCSLSTGQKGTCKILSNCPYAQNLLRSSIQPKLCGFQEQEAIVCCNETSIDKANLQVPDVAPVAESSTAAITTSTTKKFSLFGNIPTISDGKPGALSRTKCLQYHPKPPYPVLIAGGEPSLAKEFPHMALIGFGERNNTQWQCGGSLISRNFVLTAAHCLNSRDLGDAKFVLLGDLDLSTDKDIAAPEHFTIKRRIPHPSYKRPSRYHDIALLELDRDIAGSLFVTPACLHTERDLNKTRMTATGWGQTEVDGGSSSFLMKVDLDYVPNEKCIKSFGSISKTQLRNGIDDESQICAGGVIGQDTCQGDSGGPLQVHNPERTFIVQVHTIIGVTSFGKACGLSKAPGVYTRVSNYIPWIESIAWPNEKR